MKNIDMVSLRQQVKEEEEDDESPTLGRHDDKECPLESRLTNSFDAMNTILSFLSFSDYVNLSQCSKRMRSVVSTASHLYMQDEDSNSSNKRKYQHSSSHASSPQQQQLPIRLDKERLNRLVLNRFDSLSVLQLHGNMAPVGDQLFGILNAAPSARTLRSLSLHGAFLTCWCSETLKLPNLKHLRLSGGSIRLDLAAMFESVDSDDDNRLDLSSSSESSSFEELSSSSSSSSSTLLETTNCIRNTSSTMISSTAAQEPSVPAASHGPPRLQSLYIAHCSSLRDKQLRELLAKVDRSSSGRSGTSSSMMDDSEDGGGGGGSLKALSLHQCLRIKKPILRLKQLQKLSLMGCFALTQLPYFYGPRLVTLDLSFCFRLTSRRLHELLPVLERSGSSSSSKSSKSAVPCLEELILTKCPLLDHLNLASTTLRILNINFCDALQHIQLSCPRLEALEHDGCSSIHTFLLHQAKSLLEFNASGLSALSRLEISAPNAVQRLDLANCKRLQSCSIHCPHLEHVNLKSTRTVALRFCKEVRRVWMQTWMRAAGGGGGAGGAKAKLLQSDIVSHKEDQQEDRDEANIVCCGRTQPW